MTKINARSRQFRYHILRAAEKLVVPFVVARGTGDVRALIYRPEEYDVGLIEVSNVEFGELGRGSLCDISLFSRGATEDVFAQVVAESVAKRPDMVSHPHAQSRVSRS